jgi:hypothetical protein
MVSPQQLFAAARPLQHAANKGNIIWAKKDILASTYMPNRVLLYC